jgi:predicted deacylase
MMALDPDWRSVGTAVRRPGERTTGFLELGGTPGGAVGSPVIVAAGGEPGPTLWVQACVHGTEVGGIAGIHRFLESVDLAGLRGTIVAVLSANPLALRAQTRNTPYDGENLNRVFPGKHDGSHSQQVASRLVADATRVADVAVDLHSGGDRSHVPLYGIYWASGSAAARQASELAHASAVPYVWAATDSWLAHSFMAQMTEQNVPAIIIECGGAGQVGEEHVSGCARCLASVAAPAGKTQHVPEK